MTTATIRQMAATSDEDPHTLNTALKNQTINFFTVANGETFDGDLPDLT